MPEFKVPIAHEYWPGQPVSLHEIAIPYQKQIDQNIINSILEFVKNSMADLAKLRLNHVVVGLSGGLDSAIVLKICQQALGKDHITAVIVDLGLESHQEQTVRSARLAKQLQIQSMVISAAELLRQYSLLMSDRGPFTEINIITRCIQSVIFQFADSTPAAVACTFDRSELLIGRHMECFYGHFAPIAGLFKTELMSLARIIGIPDHIINDQPGCKDAWLDKDVLGASYNYIDPILYLLVEKKWTPERISQEFDIDQVWIERINYRVKHQMRRTNTRLFLFE